jgi:hypothetical protein
MAPMTFIAACQQFMSTLPRERLYTAHIDMKGQRNVNCILLVLKVGSYVFDSKQFTGAIKLVLLVPYVCHRNLRAGIMVLKMCSFSVCALLAD